MRIIDIVGLDQQADGGTHVASTRQVGGIAVVKIENKGKGFRRVRIQVSDHAPADAPPSGCFAGGRAAGRAVPDQRATRPHPCPEGR